MERLTRGALDTEGHEQHEVDEAVPSSTIQAEEDQSSLCSECKAIFDNWFERDGWESARPGHSHHHIVGLISSAKNGCSVCQLFVRGFSVAAVQQLLKDRPGLRSLVTVELELDDPVIDGTYSIRLNFHLDDSDEILTTEVDAFAAGK
jgi:hypothetical protein